MDEIKYTLFKVFYIGEHYYGSQRQPKLRTIEGQLLNALHNKGYISDEHYENQVIHSAGRTDAGVHARGMTYGIYNQRKDFYPIEINTALPDDIVVWSSTESSLDGNIPKVHPRYQAIQRHYKFFYIDSHHQLDQQIMQNTVTNLTGTHDFRNFSKLEENKNTTRTVNEINVQTNNDLILFDFKAKSFLWHQIRKMMRVIINVGSCKWEPEVVQSLFDPEDLTYALKVEPLEPNGLILWEVSYPSHAQFQVCEKSVNRLNRQLSSWTEKIQQKNSLLESVKVSFQ